MKNFVELNELVKALEEKQFEIETKIEELEEEEKEELEEKIRTLKEEAAALQWAMNRLADYTI